MRKWIPWLLYLLVVLAACSPAETTPEVAAPAQPPTQLPTEAAPILPTHTAVPAEPTAVTQAVATEPGAGEQVEATEPVPADTPTIEVQDSPKENVTVNGPYEQTFYRGAATAPVTMLDYSDFL